MKKIQLGDLNHGTRIKWKDANYIVTDQVAENITTLCSIDSGSLVPLSNSVPVEHAGDGVYRIVERKYIGYELHQFVSDHENSLGAKAAKELCDLAERVCRGETNMFIIARSNRSGFLVEREGTAASWSGLPTSAIVFDSLERAQKAIKHSNEEVVEVSQLFCNKEKGFG